MLQVKSLLKGSPAQTCDKIAIGDYIIAVNGESVYGKSLAELAEKLLGPSGSSVECTFRKEVSKEMITVQLVRGINATARNR
jgi:C-terminal processing protease CtpA/Prc